MEDITDPLRSLDLDDSEDIFKSTFNGTVGKVKITAESQAAKDADNGQEKFDVPKPVVDTSPDDCNNDVFSDCRSQHSEPDTVPLVGGTARVIDNRSSGHQTNNRLPRGDSHHQRLVEQAEAEGGDEFAYVTVQDPHRVGEGMSSFMMYRVQTRTNLRCFRRQSFSVSRRYSDFLGLHSKLVERYQPLGRIIPPAPEKSIVGTTRAKMGSTSGASDGSCSPEAAPQTKSNFISLRRAALDRFINRVALHPVLRKDKDVIDFLEASGDLPRATSTSALSSASVLRLIGRVGDTVTKMTYKMEEGDPWYEEKTQHIEQMESQLRKLHTIVDGLVQCRRELALNTGAFAQSAALLSTSEEAFHLSKTLEGLSQVEEKVEQTLNAQADADYFHILEMAKDYLALIAAVKAVLGERVKAFQTWQNAVATLHRKREQRSRMELGGRLEKMGSAIEDVTEWEQRVEEGQDQFQKISQVIKVEMSLFQHYRVHDFKEMMVQYLEDLMATQLEMVKHWETFVPEVKNIM